MAEVLGAIASGITVAALFKGSVEAFELIQVARHQDRDLEKLTLRFNIERCRLYVWGEAMGLTTVPNSGKTCLLDSTRFGDLIRGTLQAILDIFQDTDKMKRKYGCREASIMKKRKQPLPQSSFSDPVENLARTFANFKVEQVSRDKVEKDLTTRTRWIIRDRSKFSELVTEAKSLIDGLQEITKSLSTIARLEGMMRYNIQQVKDVNTLQLVADVSQKITLTCRMPLPSRSTS